VLDCPALPSLSTVAVQVLELMRDENVKLKDIAEVVQNDQALSAKILRTVNSSYYGLSRPCPTISRALSYLGLSTVTSLVLGFTLIDRTRESTDGFSMTDYWRRALYSAVAARRIAAQSRSCDQEEAFIAALMQDVGMLAIHAAAAAPYGCIVAETEGDHQKLPELERAAFGFDHAQIGAQLGERWRLPPQIIDVIRYHHHAEPGDRAELVRIVTLGLRLAIAIDQADNAPLLRQAEEQAKRWFGFNESDVAELASVIAADGRELASLLNVDTGDRLGTNRILARQEDAALRHQIDVHRRSQAMQKANNALIRQAMTDSLTEIGNRKRFDEVLTMRFEQARAFNGTLGLLLADADEFKQVNDTHGHQVGDAVLVELAQRFRVAVRGEDLVYRYGGEEFAVILPGASLEALASVAERLRHTVAGQPFRVHNLPETTEPITVTVSVGGAVFEPRTADIFRSAELFIRAADRALYAAKAAGRDSVRVFRTNGRSAAA
jgi:diguanylate cyclase (GGDEF)-like protein